MDYVISIYCVLLMIQILFTIVAVNKLELEPTSWDYIVLIFLNIFCIPIIIGLVIYLLWEKFNGRD